MSSQIFLGTTCDPSDVLDSEYTTKKVRLLPPWTLWLHWGDGWQTIPKQSNTFWLEEVQGALKAVGSGT